MNVIISGSGIASSVFASWLLKAHSDAQITIVERAPSLRLTGASVDIRSSAVDIIKWMDAEQEIRKHSTNEEGMQFVEGNDRAIATFKATGRTDIQSMTSEYEIFRGALAQVFIQPIMERVTIKYDETIEKFEQQDDGVMVTFSRSGEVKKYDLLVAADGLGSKIRGTMLNSKPREQILADKGAHIAYFTIKKDLLQGGRSAKWYNTTNGRGIFLRPDPSGDTRANLINVSSSAGDQLKERLDKALDAGNEAYMTLMEETFKDAGWLALEVLEGMRESEDFYCSLFAQVRSPKLVDGRVVLLGDAGYATPGFGTSLAITGGYVLAGELLRDPHDPIAALKRYEELLLPFAQSSQGGMGNAMQLVNPQTEWGLTIRNAVMRFVVGLRLDKLAMAGSAALGFTEKKLDFPDYEWPA